MKEWFKCVLKAAGFLAYGFGIPVLFALAVMAESWIVAGVALTYTIVGIGTITWMAER